MGGALGHHLGLTIKGARVDYLGRLFFRRGTRVQTRPASPLRLTPYSSYLLDSVVEARIAQWLVLMQRQPDVINGVLVQLRPEQRAIRQ